MSIVAHNGRRNDLGLMQYWSQRLSLRFSAVAGRKSLPEAIGVAQKPHSPLLPQWKKWISRNAKISSLVRRKWIFDLNQRLRRLRSELLLFNTLLLWLIFRVQNPSAWPKNLFSISRWKKFQPKVLGSLSRIAARMCWMLRVCRTAT